MTRLLISVRSADECRDALAAQVDLIDVKEPARGSLGGAASDVVWSIFTAVDGQRPVSVALGEIGDLDAAEIVRLPPVHYAKVGLSQMAGRANWWREWRTWRDLLPAATSPVAVAYADAARAECPRWMEVLERGLELGCRVLLLDTFDKSRGRLGDWCSAEEIGQIREATRDAGVRLALAGSLTLEELPFWSEWEPDWLALRSAVCADSRTGRLCPSRLRQARQTLDRVVAERARKVKHSTPDEALLGDVLSPRPGK